MISLALYYRKACACVNLLEDAIRCKIAVVYEIKIIKLVFTCW